VSDEPQFPEPTPLDAGRSWTAAFDSYNERTLDLYYIITLHEGGRPVARFMAELFPSWDVVDWAAARHRESLRRAIHEVAASGRTNTAYRGWRPNSLALDGPLPLS